LTDILLVVEENDHLTRDALAAQSLPAWVRVIPVPGKKAGDLVQFGGLLGTAPVMHVNGFSSGDFLKRGGRLPASVTSMRN
jgi:uncharacterized protein (UPF0210 family)